jgi:hypothetical protein
MSSTIEITTFLSSQLSSFRTFLQSRDLATSELTTYQLEKEIALHNTRMLKVVSDFNKFRNSTSPLLPTPAPNGGFECRGEWDDSEGVFTGGEEMITRRLFGGNGAGYNKEGGRNLFATHHTGRRKSKGYVRAGASTLFKSGGSGGGFERRIFGHGFDYDSSAGGMDEDETPSKRRRGGKRESGGNREEKRDGKAKKNEEGEREVVLLDSSESEGEVNGMDENNGIVEVDSDTAKEARKASSGILKSDMGRGGEGDEGNSAHRQRMNWILEMTGRKRKGGADEDEEGVADHMEKEVKRGRGRPRKNVEMGKDENKEGVKKARGRPRKIEILE